MKVVLLAGGLGTRISEETHSIPKPMIEIGNAPILLHLMRYYYSFGMDEFIVALGYKGYAIKEFFNNYHLHTSDVMFDFKSGRSDYSEVRTESWSVQLVDTGEMTMTGGRLRRLRNHLSETFMATYGDGLADVDISALMNFHKRHGKLATVTAVVPPGRYGSLEISKGVVKGFKEKPPGDGSRINGGFFVFEPEILDMVKSDEEPLEEFVLPKLAEKGELMAFEHNGFWQPMDTLRDKRLLESLLEAGTPPWIR